MALYDPVELTPFDRATTLHLLEPKRALEHFIKLCQPASAFDPAPTLEQVHNLAQLAVYLRKLPEDYEHFNMGEFFAVTGTINTPEDDVLVGITCGTSACAAGHGPAALGISRYPGEDWVSYCDRVFGNLRTEPNWVWCFGGVWQDVSLEANTPAHAAARIAAMLDPDFSMGAMSRDCRFTADYTAYTA